MIGTKKVPNVFNTLEEFPKHSKDLPAIVIGQNNSDVKLALAVAKKFSHVYLCTEQLNIEGITQANQKKLLETKNLVILPNTNITKVYLLDDALKSVELSNYSIVTCSAIFVKTEAIPEVDFVSDKLIKKNETGYLKTSNIAESTLVPKCFAIGNCCEKYTKKTQQQMIDAICADF
jgi:thioredoxin reductase